MNKLGKSPCYEQTKYFQVTASFFVEISFERNFIEYKIVVKIE